MRRLKDNKGIGSAPWMFFARAFAALFLSLGIAFGAGAVHARAQDTQPQQAPDPVQQQPPNGAQQQPPDPGPQQPPGNVARMSSVQGKVQILFSGESSPEQAVMNMPLVAGARLEAGADGQAEVEFNDGSVARLTPNSSLELKSLTAGSVELQQLTGLGYYELNVGQGHPSFSVEFASDRVTPAENTIFRVDLDRSPEAAVINGSVHVDGAQITPVDIGENQSIRFSGGSGAAPYTISQGIDPDSWDKWNSDRDQAIAQEAQQQTPVRNDAGSANNENWNDLDYYGNWYPTPDYGNVWVPSGVDAGWDPFGLGYWGNYPGFGVTWISGYPWGWLPYHCGGWNYFSFGWGWAPGSCGLGWTPFVRFRGYPGYFLPGRPFFGVRGGRGFPVGGTRLYAVNRGPGAIGPWGSGHFVAGTAHQAPLNIGGHAVAPLGRTSFGSAAFAGSRGTSPGVRAALGNSGGNSGRLPYPRAGGAVAAQGAQGAQGVRSQPSQPIQPRSFQSQAGTRSVYSQQHAAPAPHYSAPPAPHYSTPPAPHYSAPAGGGRR
jgi:FecR protein